MRTPKEITISIKNVHRKDVAELRGYLNDFAYKSEIDFNSSENKIVIYFIRSLQTALTIMLYLEENKWLWADY